MEFLDYLKPMIDWLHLHPGWAGIATFIISLSESLAIIGLLVPGSVMMTAIGTLIGAGVIPAWEIIIWAILGAIAGDSLSYRLGYHFNEHIREMWPFRRYPQMFIKGEQFFAKHGGKSVFLGRFVGPVRPIVPLIAGMLKLNSWRFFISNTTSAILWAPFYMIPGILIGAATMELSPKTATRFVIVLVTVLLIVGLSAWLIKRICSLFIRWFDRKLFKLWRFLQNHHKTVWLCRLLQDPLHPNGHGQLTLALLCVLTTISFIVFSLLVQHYGYFNTLNHYTHSLMLNLHNDTLTNIAIVITDLGYKKVIMPSALFMICFLAWKRNWRAAIHFFILIGLTSAIVLVLKKTIDSPRPISFAGVILQNSFPSGHTAGSIAVYGFYAVLIGRYLQRYARYAVYSGLISLCVLIILTRLYLNAHWLTDVIAGALLAGALLMATTISYRRQLAKKLPVLAMTLVGCLSLAGFWALSLYQNFATQQQHYTVTWPTQTMTVTDWWQNTQFQAPVFRSNIVGKPTQVINVQWLGSLDQIEQSLTASGWQEIPALTLVSAINRISSDGPEHSLPILPRLYAGQQAALSLFKPVEESQLLVVMRLWNADVNLEGTTDNLWYGTITYQLPRGYQVWQYQKIHHVKRRLPPAILQIPQDLPTFEMKKIAYPISDNPVTRIPPNQWRGGILLIKPATEQTQ